MFSGVASRAQELWHERTTGTHQQGRRPLPENVAGAGAHYILGPFGPDSDLRRWGLKLAERGGKNAKKRAVVAVARKPYCFTSCGSAEKSMSHCGTWKELITSAGAY